MNYFIDFEFIEGFHKPFLGKKRHYIDMISVGIVCEDGREYYAVSNEYNFKDADEWVRHNVINTLFRQAPCYIKNMSSPVNIHKFIGKPNKEIAKDIIQFVCPYDDVKQYNEFDFDDGMKRYLLDNPPKFYGYYADYDWVLFCSLFGRMIDLPKGFPMFCRDLKQDIDEFSNKIYKEKGHVPVIQNIEGYPINVNEHNALYDARWNRDLHGFLSSLLR